MSAIILIHHADSALVERSTLRTLGPGEQVDITVLGSDQDYVPTRVGHALEDCEGVLALVDLPNGDVGMEIGWALARGRR